MQNLENLDVFEIWITQKLLKCLKDPFLRSALNYIIGPGYDKRYPMAILIKIKVMMRLQSTTLKSIF